MTRRHALLLTSTTLSAQVDDLANTLELEPLARKVLPPALFDEIKDGSRAAFDRITFRPRMMVNTLGIDLTTPLFGQQLFAPILIGPLALLSRFHPDAEDAMLAGAAAAKCPVVVAARTSKPAGAPVWLQVDPAQPAIAPSARVLFLTAPFDWPSFDRLRAATTLPIVIKGILTPAAAQQAIQRGANGIVVSSYRASTTAGLAAPIDVLPAIAAEVNRKLPILIDGGFRRGSDILKALALGAQAVLIGRPALWGLAAYGARGVQHVVEQLQTELARDMAMCGLVRCSQASPRYVTIHRR
jgi:4-hydroxymandelate oxidase